MSQMSSIFSPDVIRMKREILNAGIINIHDPLPSDQICTLDEVVSADEIQFRDIGSHWAKSFIEKLTRYWIVKNQDTYRPDAPMTR